MTRSDALIVLQARLGSRRLPGKALRRLEGISLLTRCLLRLVASGAAPVLLATTSRREDDALVAEAARCGVTSVRGPRDDVLARFAKATEIVQPRFVIRATGDNPAVDADGIGRVLAVLRCGGVDYVVEQGLPYGSAVEGIRAEALLEAAERATDPYDREHVTPFLKRPEMRHRVASPDAPLPVRRPDLRFTVDTPADFEWMARVFARAGARAPTLPLSDIIRAADTLAGWQEVA
jgi:spore coat polysaccharide biosynthesis protein SpsF (cytidylyltransferase family)